MGPIERAVDNFRCKRRRVYEVDPDQIVRDARVAERAIKDHVGRWLFEVLQNSDDARASKVLILIDENTVYVGDNGRGIKTKTVDAISGTDFSDKNTGTIGRKGVGFKSVYEISASPQVLTVNGEGIEFCPEKAKSWLRDNGLNYGHVPYQWIPFFVSWDEARQNDPALVEFTEYKTVVRLPNIYPNQKHKIEKILCEWPPHTLLAFRHVRELRADPYLLVRISQGDRIWEVQNTEGDTPTQWNVVRNCEMAPEVMSEVVGEEWRSIKRDGVSFLIAAPIEDGYTVPTTEFLPVHVFYPTEQRGPVRLMLHAEFLVKSDRTALIPIEDNLFNQWVAERLAFHVCGFVQGAYILENPGRNMRLLVPFAERDSHPVASNLWNRIAENAQKLLTLADIDGNQRLQVGDAILLSVSVASKHALLVLEGTEHRQSFLHHTYYADKEACKVLREIGCREIRDKDLIGIITEHPESWGENHERIWSCWEWLSQYAAEKPYGDDHDKRLGEIKRLPIVPVSGRLCAVTDLEGNIISWRSNFHGHSLPEWIPLIFLDDWFRDRVQELRGSTSPILNLLENLQIKEADEDILHRGIGRAIQQYWKDKQGDPGRFLRYIVERKLYEFKKSTGSTLRCPIKVRRGGSMGIEWAGAGNAYFGAEWGKNTLANLYEGNPSVLWAIRLDGDLPIRSKVDVLAWLGVNKFPRIVDDPDNLEWEQNRIIRELPRRPYNDISAPLSIQHIKFPVSNKMQAVSLLRLLAIYWNTYYKNLSVISVAYKHYSLHYYSFDSAWWDSLKKLLIPPQRGNAKSPLCNCWLPDKRTEHSIGDLLPAIDIDADSLGEDKVEVRDWLVKAVQLRTHIEQVTVEEWRDIITKRIPDLIPAPNAASDDRLRDKVAGWYGICLDAVGDKENVAEDVLGDCPLLCRKAEGWEYIKDAPRYLSDEHEFSKAFDRDVWQLYLPSRLKASAKKHFGVQALSSSVQVKIETEEPIEPLPDRLQKAMDGTLPYVYVWRVSQSKQDTEKLALHLKSLKAQVVSRIVAYLHLADMRRTVLRSYAADESSLLLHKDHQDESTLAQALAQAMGIKSEADFYENLLRCKDNTERREKLFGKGITVVELDRCLRQYSSDQQDEMPLEGGGESLRSVPEPHPPKPTPPDEKQEEPRGGESKIAGESRREKTGEKDTEQKHFVRYKDPIEAEYVVRDARAAALEKQEGEGGDGGEKGREGGGEEGEERSERPVRPHNLSEEEKIVLEQAGRVVARRELERMDYTVEEKPYDNPGYDLLASKLEEEMRVEVKGHGGRSSVVDLTHRQYKEYLRQDGYRWELWNVEHLEEQDEKSVTITRYIDIPDDALSAQSYSVNLRKCQEKGS